MENIDSATPAVCHTAPRTGPGSTAIELRRNGFFPILIVILLLISKNLSRARLRLGLRLYAYPFRSDTLSSCRVFPAATLARAIKLLVFRPFLNRPESENQLER